MYENKNIPTRLSFVWRSQFRKESRHERVLAPHREGSRTLVRSAHHSLGGLMPWKLDTLHRIRRMSQTLKFSGILKSPRYVLQDCNFLGTLPSRVATTTRLFTPFTLRFDIIGGQINGGVSGGARHLPDVNHRRLCLTTSRASAEVGRRDAKRPRHFQVVFGIPMPNVTDNLA